MANFTPQKIDLSQINNGQKYENGDGINSQAINAPIEASAYAQELSETTQNNFQQLETSTNSFMQSTQQDVTSFKEQVNTEISSINAEVETFKSDTNDDINSFKTQVNQNIESFKSDVNNEIADLENQIAQGQGTIVTIGGVSQSSVELNSATVGNATNATNDGNGDNIANTYAKQNGTYQNLKAGNAEKSNALNRTYYSNLNDATEGGTLFYGNTGNNQNTAQRTAFAGQVLEGGEIASDDYLVQKVAHYGGIISGVDSTVTREYVRGKRGISWQNWQEIPSIVEDWQSSDGLSWYRIWSNGLKECGGTLTANNSSTPLTVALPITFSNATSYTIVTGVYGGKSNQVACVKIIDDSLTSSSFQILGTYAAMGATNYYKNKFHYYCRGR